MALESARTEFPHRRIAPPPERPPARRSHTAADGDLPLTIRQHVYQWAREVLHWESASQQLGDRNPLPPPAPLTIPPEHVWALAVELRTDRRRAQDLARQIAHAELVRLCRETDHPPASWRLAAAHWKPTWWSRLRAALTR